MKIFFKKLLVCLLIIVLLFNFLFSTPSQAVTAENAVANVMDWMVGITDGIVGILTWLYRIPVVACIAAVTAISGAFAGVFGYVDEYGSVVEGERSRFFRTR